MKPIFVFLTLLSLALGISGARAQPPKVQHELQGIFDVLSNTAPEEEVRQLAGAVNASPQLAKQLIELASSGKLTQIKIVPQRTWGKPFNAIADGTAMIFTADFIKSQFGRRLYDVVYPDDIPPNNLVYCIGHLAYHLNAGPIDPRSASNPADFSNKVVALEASASIQGWNDVVDAAVVANGRKVLSVRQAVQLLMNLRYRFAFLKALQQQQKLQMLNSGIIEPNQTKISAIVIALKNSSLADIE